MARLPSQRGLGLSPIEVTVCLLGVLCLCFSFYAVSVGFGNSLYDFHGFRQTQTAISADSMLHGGSFLRYETPVFGPPWSLPFEFPLYQGIVATLAKWFSTPLDQTGRFVSIFFYYLCFFPLASILARIGLRGTQIVPALAIFAVSPIYVFVSRLFMIESTALCFSLLYADQMFRLVVGKTPWRYRHIVGAALFGITAGLVKVTTLAPFFVLGSCLAAWGLWKDRELGRSKLGIAAAVAFFCVLLPVAATGWWTRFADGVKAQNPFGVYLTSKALSPWTFGPLAERFHPRIYLQLLSNANNQIGSIWLSVIMLLVFLWLFRKWNGAIATCVALYIGTILLFFNLHVVHEYYPYSNAIFLVVATGVLIAVILKMPGRCAWIGVVLLMLEIASCNYRYFTHYYPIQRKNAQGRPETAALIDGMTDPRGAILIVGLDWSAEFPYQSHRRAIMSTTWSLQPTRLAIANEGAKNVTALVACDKGRYGSVVPELLADLGMDNSTNLHANDCDLFVRPTVAGLLPGDHEELFAKHLP